MCDQRIILRSLFRLKDLRDGFCVKDVCPKSIDRFGGKRHDPADANELRGGLRIVGKIRLHEKSFDHRARKRKRRWHSRPLNISERSEVFIRRNAIMSLFVNVGIIAVLIGLLLPAVQNIR